MIESSNEFSYSNGQGKLQKYYNESFETHLSDFIKYKNNNPDRKIVLIIGETPTKYEENYYKSKKINYDNINRDYNNPIILFIDAYYLKDYHTDAFPKDFKDLIKIYSYYDYELIKTNYQIILETLENDRIKNFEKLPVLFGQYELLFNYKDKVNELFNCIFFDSGVLFHLNPINSGFVEELLTLLKPEGVLYLENYNNTRSAFKNGNIQLNDKYIIDKINYNDFFTNINNMPKISYPSGYLPTHGFINKITPILHSWGERIKNKLIEKNIEITTEIITNMNYIKGRDGHVYVKIIKKMPIKVINNKKNVNKKLHKISNSSGIKTRFMQNRIIKPPINASLLYSTNLKKHSGGLLKINRKFKLYSIKKNNIFKKINFKPIITIKLGNRPSSAAKKILTAYCKYMNISKSKINIIFKIREITEYQKNNINSDIKSTIKKYNKIYGPYKSK